MASRPRLVVLDAGAIFGALEHGAWDHLTASYDVLVPAIILNEVHFFVSRETRTRIPVDTHVWVDEGRVRRYEATADELRETLSLINAPDGPEIHEGEAEALTFLRLEVGPGASDVAFVSADGAAIQATTLLDLSHTARCLAEVLETVGYQKPLPRRHRREFVEEHLQRGFERRLRRGG